MNYAKIFKNNNVNKNSLIEINNNKLNQYPRLVNEINTIKKNIIINYSKIINEFENNEKNNVQQKNIDNIKAYCKVNTITESVQISDKYKMQNQIKILDHVKIQEQYKIQDHVKIQEQIKILEQVKIPDVITEYYKIIGNKPISDHEPIVSSESNIVSWNVQKDSCFFDIYSWDSNKNYLNKFNPESVDYINMTFGVGKKFRFEMESNVKYSHAKYLRYEKISKKIKSLVLDENNTKTNIPNSKFRICLQECNYELYEYLRENLGFKYIKFIGQDIEGIFVGNIQNFTKDFEYFVNWYKLKSDEKTNKSLNKIVSDNINWKNIQKKIKSTPIDNSSNITNKKSNGKSNRKSGVKLIDLFTPEQIDLNWKNFLSTDLDIWDNFIEVIRKKYQEEFMGMNRIKNPKEKTTGCVIMSNSPFVMLPCFSRILYTNAIISAENIKDTYGLFVIKSRGCVGIDFTNGKNPCLINVHLPKNRIKSDLTKLLDNDLFSIGFEYTAQIEKYFFCSDTNENFGLNWILDKIFPSNSKLQNTFKNILITVLSKKLHSLFIDKIFESNNIKKDILEPLCLDFKNKIYLNNQINIDILNSYEKHDFPQLFTSENLEQNYLSTQSIDIVYGKINSNKKMYIVGDFNCGINLIQSIITKHYIDKYLNFVKKKISNQELSNYEYVIEYIKEIDNLKESINNNYCESICESICESWDMIYLGGRFQQNFIPKSNNSDVFKKINENIFLRIKGHGLNWDRTTHSYVVNKKNIANIYNLILQNFQSTNIIEQIDHLYIQSSKLTCYDYFPHLFYSPANYTSDIQNNNIRISGKELKNLK